MPWWEFALLGAGGGVIVEVLAIFRWVAAWQDARRGKDGLLLPTPPKLGKYVDLPAHAIMLRRSEETAPGSDLEMGERPG